MSVIERVGSIFGLEPADTTIEETTVKAVSARDERLAEFFDLLSVHRRRHVVEEVAALGPEEEIELGALSNAIAYTENDVPNPGSVTGQQRKRVYVSLYQTHLPKLDEAGMIEFDRRSNLISRGPMAKLADRVVRAARREIPKNGGGSP